MIPKRCVIGGTPEQDDALMHRQRAGSLTGAGCRKPPHPRAQQLRTVLWSVLKRPEVPTNGRRA